MRLIDADALIESLNKKHERFCELCGDENKDINYAHEYAVNMTGDAPAVEPSGDLISRADAIEAVKDTKPVVRSTERNWGKMIAEQHSKELVKAIKALPSAEAVSRKAIMSAKFHPLPYTHITPTDVDAESYKRGWNDALDAVADNAPSAEAVQGEWVKSGLKDDMWYCTSCGSPIMTDDILENNFCPNCGAKMTKGGDDTTGESL